MDIKTVAVYSDADRHSMFVKEADEAYRIGPAPTNQSYLDMNKILDVVKKTGAQAVHPGYGFLSENKLFQKLLHDNDVTFIGPPGPAITAMGDKLESKHLAKEAKVNTVPGFLGSINSDEEVIEKSNQIGYPVMIKASAGGGGKGMRIAWNDQEAIEGFNLSKSEAKAAFGDDTILIEKYIEEPRHIEFQILGDQHGNYVYLPERECSVQRRNQKVIEEAPSVLLTPQTRHAMGTQAISLAAACGYYSTGTVEFLVDKHLGFYFLEMNTRLQVEHPITEEITGIDLVEEMIKIAAGLPLELKQDDVKINGHSVEMRVYAEDPSRNFLPSIGFLKKYIEPYAHEHIRIDTGVQEGSEISMYYDPMISKTITWGKTREDALALMDTALKEYVINGVTDNCGFGLSIIHNEDFKKGTYDTSFIPKYYPEGYHGEVQTHEDAQAIAIAAAKLRNIHEEESATIGYPHIEHKSLYVTVGEKDYKVVISDDHTEYTVETVGEDNAEVIKVNNFGIRKFSLIRMHYETEQSQRLKECVIHYYGCTNELDYNWYYKGSVLKTRVYDAKEYQYKKYMAPPAVIDTSKVIMSPMPGAIIEVFVKEGDTVQIEQPLFVMEAMKMQNIIKSEAKGKIAKIKVAQGDSVAVDEIMLELE